MNRRKKLKQKTITILKIETDSLEDKKRTLDMIVPLMSSETFELIEGTRKDYIVEAGTWIHLKKKGK